MLQRPSFGIQVAAFQPGVWQLELSAQVGPVGTLMFSIVMTRSSIQAVVTSRARELSENAGIGSHYEVVIAHTCSFLE